MEQIRYGLMDGLKVSIYADPKCNYRKMEKVRKKLKEKSMKKFR